jgi:biopolymer transport protein ExbB/TolQ
MLALLSAAAWAFQDESFWTPWAIWQQSGWLSRLSAMMLAMMMLRSAIALGWRTFSNAKAQIQTRRFRCVAHPLIARGDLHGAIAAANAAPDSHVAFVIADGLRAFASWPLDLPHADAVEAARRAMVRSQNYMRARLRLGIGPLQNVAATAVFIGVGTTVLDIPNAFRGGCDRCTGFSLVAGGMAMSLYFTALGLSVAIPAMWFANHLIVRSERLDMEVSNAASELLSQLFAHPEIERKLAIPAETGGNAPTKKWGIPYDHQRSLLVPIVGFHFLVWTLLLIAFVAGLIDRISR